MDLDGVLAEIVEMILTKVGEKYGVELVADEMDKYDLWQYLKDHGVSHAQIQKVIKDEWLWSGAKPIQENIDCVNSWVGDGHEVHIVTSRAVAAAIPTHAWLKKHKVSYTKLRLQRAMQKFAYMQEIGSSIIVEDRFFEANKCGSYGLYSYVVRRPYNLEYESRVINKKYVRFVDSMWDINLEVDESDIRVG